MIESAHGRGWSLYQCGYEDLARIMREARVKADALIVDAPYSAKTHTGHARGASDANRMANYGGAENKHRRYAAKKAAAGGTHRRAIDYAHWTPDDVARFVGAFSGLVEGWWGAQTDDVLRAAWESALERAGLYTFAPIPCVESGATVRMTGDGPPSWTTHLVTGTDAEPEDGDLVSELALARPRSETWRRWAVRVDREARGARPLPGYYLVKRERKPIVGGKPIELLRQIVGDYSAPGALVCDPCAGGGTTLVAATQIGRGAIGSEPDPGRFAIAVERLRAAEREIPK